MASSAMTLFRKSPALPASALLALAALVCAFSASSTKADPPADGFVLTQWGRWTHVEAVAALDQAALAGARQISILVMLCQKDLNTSSVHWCESPDGERLEESYQGARLRALLPELRRRGLSVSFIPFPWVEDRSPRAGIWPRDRAAWFGAYAEHLEQLAVFASENNVEELIVASELTKLFWLESPWRDLIRRIRPLYRGHLTLSPIAAQYALIRFWDELDSIGLSAYFPLTVHPALSSVGWLERAWRANKAHLKAFAASQGKPLTFVEVGYPTTHVAPTMPWDFQWDKRKHDELAPARCWEAFRRVWAGEEALRGFRVWGLTGQEETPKAFSPIGKAAETPVRLLFNERLSL